MVMRISEHYYYYYNQIELMVNQNLDSTIQFSSKCTVSYLHAK